MKHARLTKRESEIAELIAWGATKKEIATRLFVSSRTIENHARNIFHKTGCSKMNELSAWWFCTNFNISFSLSPLSRTLVATFMLVVITPQILLHDDGMQLTRTSARTMRTTCRTGRRTRNDDYQF